MIGNAWIVQRRHDYGPTIKDLEFRYRWYSGFAYHYGLEPPHYPVPVRYNDKSNSAWWQDWLIDCHLQS